MLESIWITYTSTSSTPLGICLNCGVSGMKPKLLINVGTNHSATTPLYYTLSVSQKYCHCGHRKESHYLHLVETQGKWQHEVDKFLATIHGKKGTPRPPEFYENIIDGQLDWFFRPPFTLDRYVEYHLAHWENIKHEYQSCGDFSNHNAALSENFLYRVKSKLEKHFDVKCVIIMRDPIRRMYSLSKTNDRFLEKLDNPKYDDLKEYQATRYMDYVGICKRWSKVWGSKFFPIVMEEFWEDQRKLSEFLEYSITDVYDNVFYPEMGVNASKHAFLNDQWSVKEEMTENSLNVAKKKMNHIYQEFKEYFGYIPSAWQSS